MSLTRIVLVLLLSTAGLAHGADAPAAAPSATGARWYKGNLHTHSLWSDGDDFPERIATWYRDHGYDFLGISDHNSLQRGDKWVKYGALYRKGAGPAADAYLRAFADTAKVRGDAEAGTQEIRLAPFTEYQKLVERPGKFLLIPAEEVTDHFEKRPIHMGGINLDERVAPQGGASVAEVIANNCRAIEEQGTRLGRPVLAHLNHPNFVWGVTAQEMAQVVEERFFEVYNGHPSVNQLGDATRPSIDRMWDIANTLRLTQLKARPLFGLGSDDSHHYHVDGLTRAAPGRGWICVRAAALEPGALLAAMRAGDFYASSGVVLSDVKYDAAAGTLSVEIKADGAARFTTQFVGTLTAEAGDPARVGVVLATAEGRSAAYRLTGKELYVRAIVTSDRDPKSPSFQGQKQQAWTQPVGWDRRPAPQP